MTPVPDDMQGLAKAEYNPGHDFWDTALSAFSRRSAELPEPRRIASMVSLIGTAGACL